MPDPCSADIDVRSRVLALLGEGDRGALARALSIIEDHGFLLLSGGSSDGEVAENMDASHVVGITGAPGVGKSTLVSALVAEYRRGGHRVGVLAVDPSSPVTGGALLGDRLRMSRHTRDPDVYIRSLANRGRSGGLAGAVPGAVQALALAGFDRILIESVGVGQSELAICRESDTVVVVNAPGLGDSVQVAKAGIMEVADVFVVNKSDLEGASVTARDLSRLARMGQPHEWRVPVIATDALAGKGVDELVAAIERHREHVGREPTSSRLHGRALHNATEAVVDELATRVRGHLGTDSGRRALEQLVAGAIDLDVAASTLLGLLVAATRAGDAEVRPLQSEQL
jgi:LAO/AO transport system kinase